MMKWVFLIVMLTLYMEKSMVQIEKRKGGKMWLPPNLWPAWLSTGDWNNSRSHKVVVAAAQSKSKDRLHAKRA